MNPEQWIRESYVSIATRENKYGRLTIAICNVLHYYQRQLNARSCAVAYVNRVANYHIISAISSNQLFSQSHHKMR